MLPAMDSISMKFLKHAQVPKVFQVQIFQVSLFDALELK